MPAPHDDRDLALTEIEHRLDVATFYFWYTLGGAGLMSILAFAMTPAWALWACLGFAVLFLDGARRWAKTRRGLEAEKRKALAGHSSEG